MSEPTGPERKLDRRRAAESELAELHRMVSELTGLVPGLLYVLDLPGQRASFVGRHASQLLGYGDPEFSELSLEKLLELIHPADAQALRVHLSELHRMADGETRPTQYRCRHRDGTWRWFQGRDSVLRRGADGRVIEVIGVATDVTEQKRAEETLRATAEQQHYRAELADALRATETPEQAERVAAGLLGRHLHVAGVQYATVSEDGEEGVPAGQAPAEGAGQGLNGLDGHGAVVVRELRAGRTVHIEDVSGDERLSTAEQEALLGMNIRASVIVPLMRLGRPAAALTVHQGAPRRWSAAELTLIAETAERTQAAVERAAAVAALAEREARYRSLFSSIDEGYCLCEIVTDENGRPIDYRFLEVNPRFEERTGLVNPVGRRAREMVPDLEEHWVETMGRVALNGETVRYSNRAEALHRWFDVFATPVEPIGTGRFMVVVNDVTERQEAEEALRENAARARRGRARSEFVTSVMRELEALDRLRPLAERLVRTLVPRLADYALLEIPSRAEPVLALSHRDPHQRSILRTLRDEHRVMSDTNSIARATAGEPRLIEHISEELLQDLAGGSARMAALLKELGPISHIAVPIDISGEPGALLLGRSDPSRPRFGSEELTLAQEIARRVSVLFAHAQVREEEHAIGVRLQQALLPEALLAHPAIQVAARYQTGNDLLYVGGDWYDTLALSQGRIALAVGDVVGHGLEAAASMSRLRIALATLAPQAPTPGELLARLADFSRGANGVQFATAACGFLDPATGELSYSSAGHPPALVVSPDGGSRWLEHGRSMPLGAVALPSVRPDARDRLEPGDLLILYSDGLVERRGEPIGTGLARLETAARSAADLPIDQLCARLVDELTNTSSNDDDAVILCLRFSPVTLSGFQRRIPAHPGELAPTREALRAWLRRRQDPVGLGHRLLLTVGEALTNAIEHAYRDRPPGVVELAISLAGPDALRVQVRDHGRWREAVSRPGRGHGFRVIRGLTRGFERESDAGGTTLSFELPIRENPGS